MNYLVTASHQERDLFGEGLVFRVRARAPKDEPPKLKDVEQMKGLVGSSRPSSQAYYQPTLSSTYGYQESCLCWGILSSRARDTQR